MITAHFVPDFHRAVSEGFISIRTISRGRGDSNFEKNYRELRGFWHKMLHLSPEIMIVSTIPYFMSVQSEINRVSYHGNASNLNPYGVPFYFLDENDLVVVVTDQEGEDEIARAEHGLFCVWRRKPGEGGIITVVAIPATSTVTIYREDRSRAKHQL